MILNSEMNDIVAQGLEVARILDNQIELVISNSSKIVRARITSMMLRMEFAEARSYATSSLPIGRHLVNIIQEIYIIEKESKSDNFAEIVLDILE